MQAFNPNAQEVEAGRSRSLRVVARDPISKSFSHVLSSDLLSFRQDIRLVRTFPHPLLVRLISRQLLGRAISCISRLIVLLIGYLHTLTMAEGPVLGTFQDYSLKLSMARPPQLSSYIPFTL